MVLLSPEKIIAYSTKDCEYCDLAVEVGKWAAKAQLKKVVEWGNELCYDHNGEQREEQGWFVKRHDCPLCWQDLKKEASLDT